MTDHRLRELYTQQPIGPWKAKVSITASDVTRGRMSIVPSDVLYTVNAEWTGPPAPGFPPSDKPVAAACTVVGSSYRECLRIAQAAAAKLRDGQVPNLRKIAGKQAVGPARGLLA